MADALILQGVTIELLGGPVLDKTEVSIDWQGLYTLRTGGSYIPKQVFLGFDLPTVTVKFFNTDNNAFKDFYPNMPIQSFDVTSDLDADESILHNKFFTLFPVDDMVAKRIQTGVNPQNPSECTLEIGFNVLNTGDPTE